MALAPDSPAIDWAPLSGAPSTDQRGFPRPYGSGVDLGAFELGPLAPAISASRSGSMIALSFIAQSGVTYQLQRSADFMAWQTQETISTNGTVMRSFPASGPRQFYRLGLSW
jgi:hypothetical protein